MERERKTGTKLIGWPGSVAMFVLYVVSEWMSQRLGGNLGSFLWVTFHFILMPLLSVILVVLILIRAVREKGGLQKLAVLSSVTVPILIIAIALRADAGLLRWLGPIRP